MDDEQRSAEISRIKALIELKKREIELQLQDVENRRKTEDKIKALIEAKEKELAEAKDKEEAARLKAQNSGK